METVDEFKQVQSVTKRRVFYIPGYDPIHPRRYRELFRKEGADQAKISGYKFDLEAKKEGGAYGWHASTDIDGQHTDAQVDVLIWSDIVRASMSNSIPATYMQLLRTAYAYISTGALFRLMRLRKGPIIAALRPGDMMVLTADHGNDPTWVGTDHTRERVPVLVAGVGTGELGQIIPFGST